MKLISSCEEIVTVVSLITTYPTLPYWSNVYKPFIISLSSSASGVLYNISDYGNPLSSICVTKYIPFWYARPVEDVPGFKAKSSP